jgi:hypothetical protein
VVVMVVAVAIVVAVIQSSYKLKELRRKEP